MPPATRRRGGRRHSPPSPARELLADPASDADDTGDDQAAAIAAAVAEDFTDADTGNEEGEGEEDAEDGDKDEQDGAVQETLPTTAPPIPPNLKEISSLASWTVSTSKPGCGVAQLRSPSTALFWQSDGPQPHTLNIHFFKLVGIAALRVYLDFDQDESYTPTRIAFLAGTGPHDLQEFSSLNLDQPRGWIDVDFGNVGDADGGDGEDDGDIDVDDNDEEMIDEGMTGGSEDDGNTYEDDDLEQETDNGGNDEATREEEDDLGQTGDPSTVSRQKTAKSRRRRRRRRMPKKMPILRAFLVQVKIMENHQNGKDTHLRGLQIFARDKTAERVAPVPRARHSSRAEAATDMALRPRKRMVTPDWGLVPELR